MRKCDWPRCEEKGEVKMANDGYMIYCSAHLAEVMKRRRELIAALYARKPGECRPPTSVEWTGKRHTAVAVEDVPADGRFI